jgi:beta-galactosidase
MTGFTIGRVIAPVIGVLFFGALFQANAVETIRFSDNWKFNRGEADGAQEPSYGDGSWETVYLPHTVRLESVGNPDNYLGICWYRKSFFPNASWDGQRVFLEFEAAMQTAQVYCNGTLLTTHYGGYDPFVLDITGNVQYGSTNVIAVRLDNTPSSSFPPGHSDPDMRYFGGLYRNVNVYVTDPLHITNPFVANIPGGGGVFVTYPSVSVSSATVRVVTHVINQFANARSCAVTTTIKGKDGSPAATNTTTAQNLAAGAANAFTQNITVSNPQLWHPDHPYLYTVVSEVYDGTRPADTLITPIGIRTLAFSKANGFQINEARYRFVGANRHQDYPYIGNAVPNSGQYRDALLLKEHGFNFVRMSHYVQAKAFVDACDKLGIMTMACLPGWQYFNNNAAFMNNSLAVLRTMIRYYRNHPSVVLWEAIHNESYGGSTAAFMNSAQTAAKEEFGNSTQMFTCGEETSSGGASNAIMDVYMSSGQHGVYAYSGPRPCVISEYGDWEFGGFTSTSRVDRSQGESAMLTQVTNQALGNTTTGLSTFYALSWLTGTAVWSGFDYQAWSADPLCSSGAFDIFRIPKFSAHFFRSQRDPAAVIAGVNSGPMVFIASFWNSTSARTPLKVFSNCERINLYLNGTAIVTNKAPEAISIPYPWFGVTVNSFTSGTLVAEGLIGNTVRARDTVMTPGAATRVAVTIETPGQTLLADGSDIAMVYASIVDTNGTVVPNASNSVAFTVSGTSTARLITTTVAAGQTAAAQAGIATVLLRAGTAAGQITVNATSGPLAAGSATVTAVALPVTGIAGRLQTTALKTLRQLAFHRTGSMLAVEVPCEAAEHSGMSFTLCNAQGRLVGRWPVAGERFSVALSLPQGVYFAQVIGSGVNLVRKVLW